MTDLLVVSLEAWDLVRRRNQHLVRGLLQRDPTLRVLFVEPPADPVHAVRQGHRPRLGAGLRPAPAEDGLPGGRLWLYAPTKWLPRRLDPHQDSRRGATVVATARHMGFTDPVVWVNDPLGVAVVEASGWRHLYDITDDWLVADRPAAETDRLATAEAALLARADAVVACSAELARRKGAARAVHTIPNGVDTAAYGVDVPRPDLLPPGPVALYAGTVHTDRIDPDLVAATARAVEGRATVVLVGPDLLPAPAREGLIAAGVRLVGPVAADQIPALLRYAEVLLVPHVQTAFTASLDPIKAYEYRAAGRPVVSTPVAGFASGGRVTVAQPAAFPAAVARTLDVADATAIPGQPDDDIAEIDWSARVAAFAQVLGSIASA